MIQFLDPRAEPMAAEEPYVLETRLEAGDVVGLLANGFADSGRFLEHVGRELARAVPGLDVRAYAKPNASVPAAADLLDGITKECKAVVTAYGH